MGRTADIARADNQWIALQARAWISEWGRSHEGDETTLSISRFRELPEALKNHVVREMLKTTTGSLRRMGLVHIEAVKRLAEGTRPQARLTLPSDLLVKRMYDRLIFSKGLSPPADTYCYYIERTGSFLIDALGCTLTLKETETGRSPQDLGPGAWTASFDADRIAFPLMIRNFRPGDRFVPLGMKGHKKLKDLFVDMKIPADVRARIPILVQGDRVVWVCGVRMDDRFKVTPSTRRVLKVAFDTSGTFLPDDLQVRE